MSIERKGSEEDKRITVISKDSGGDLFSISNYSTDKFKINGPQGTWHFAHEIREMIAAMQEMIGDEVTVNSSAPEVDKEGVTIGSVKFQF